MNKKIIFLLISTFGLFLLSSCEQKTSSSDSEQILPEIEIEKQVENIIDEKFLITNNSVGYFQIGNSWQNVAKNTYNYKTIQGFGLCIDGCCGGGFPLGNKIINDEYYGTIIENPEIIIGAMVFDQDEDYDESKYKSNPNIFYPVSSDDFRNCGGWWYWKDKSSYIVINSDLFKTKEGIGVGTTLEEVQKKIGNLHFYVGWIEEDVNALKIIIKSYPNIEFILDVDDYKENWEEISLSKDENSLTISDFKRNSKIKRLIVNQID